MALHNVDKLFKHIETISLSHDKPSFKYLICEAGYSTEGYLQCHMEEKEDQTKMM